MFKSILFSVVALLAVNVQAADEQWCIWDGQEYLKDIMVDGKKHWLQAVKELHQSETSQDVSGAYEAVGSCRFLNRNLGETASDVIAAYLDSYSLIVASRAYLKIDGGVEVVLPKAFYTAGTNQLLVFKDFYSMNRPVCEKQKQEMLDLGQQSQGIRFADVSAKVNTNGGVSVILNESTLSASYLGVCYFH